MSIRTVIVLLLMNALGGCQAGDDISFNPNKKDSNSSAHAVQGGFGNGQLTGVDLTSDDGNMVYPITEFYGTGILVSIDHNPIQVRTRQEISREKVISHTTQFTSSDKTINKNVIKLVGHTTYVRVPKQELANRAHDSDFKNVPFLMYSYSSDAINQNGAMSLKFNNPFPFLVIPTDMHHYDVLKQSAMVFETTVRGSAEFLVRTTIQEESRSGDIIKIQVINDIPQDTDGRLYDKFPLPRLTSYEIDTKDKKVVRMNTATFYYNENRKKRRDMNVNFALCVYQLKDKVDQRPCGG